MKASPSLLTESPDPRMVISTWVMFAALAIVMAGVIAFVLMLRRRARIHGSGLDGADELEETPSSQTEKDPADWWKE